MDTPKAPTEQDDQGIQATDSTVATQTAETSSEVSSPPSVIVPPSPPAALAEASQNNPVTLVLQWLTYAFWGWFALAILWLSAITIAFLVVGADSSDWSAVIAYPIAAVVVLFLVAGVVDFFYSRIEPARKQGVGTAIMVIHAVLFALCGIGAVIGVVFALINLLLSSGANELGKATLTSLYVSLVMIFVYALLVVRTVLVAKIRRISWITSGILGGLALVFIILGVIGPVAQSIVTRQDREIESTLPQIPSEITSYVQDNDKLPASLDQLQYDGVSSRTADEVKGVVGRGLIKYTPNTKEPKKSSAYATLQDGEKAASDTILYPDSSSTTTYYYRLCVNWQAEKNYDDDRGIPYPAEDLSSGSDETVSYPSYISAYSHKKGEQCYDLQANKYDY